MAKQIFNLKTITMKTLELEKFGVMSMEQNEMQVVFGGGTFPKWLKSSGWSYLAMQIVDHWGEIKQGFAQGYKAKI
jgi:hypothetical protein